ncbi:hypothetical protein NCER_101662 [Vairimorpha ceranae BRL01]|uniref:Uncharacterized protein n=2 Tax=Vairimorpha ceranae TaxID=40302 RepID=C4VAI5_VAIC1|nr:hypothetical protein NCER_101662 [Vairimorpha ceranae BRL01]
MYLFLKIILLFYSRVYTFTGTNLQFNNSMLNALCSDNQPKDPINCQPNFNTQIENPNIFPMPSNRPIIHQENCEPNLINPPTMPILSPGINTASICNPHVASNIAHPSVSTNILQPPLIPNHSYPIIPPIPLPSTYPSISSTVPYSSISSPTPYKSSNFMYPSVPNTHLSTAPSFIQNQTPRVHSEITLSNIPLENIINNGIPTGQRLSTVLNENPIAKTQLINFLEYNGVPPPWDQLLDFETTQHHQLPDPDNLFRKIRKQLLTFDNVRTCIVEALVVIEKYINRGKAYLAEDLKDLCRDKTLLKNILKRLRTKPAYEFRSELFKRYADIKCKSLATQKSFRKLRDWLLKIKRRFATL